MLGKLFNLTAGAAGAPNIAQDSSINQASSLESVQEDIHTRTLLFPDAQALYQHRNDQVFPMSSASALPNPSMANAFDLDSDIELETRDVRIIIMQDTIRNVPACLLYDSQSPPPQSPQNWATERPSTMAGPSHSNPQDARRAPSSPRKASASQSSTKPVVIQPDSPQPRQSAFDRRSSMHGRTYTKSETESQRATREYKQEIDTLSSCIFGNNDLLAYKGTSTKVHVVPSDTRQDLSGSVLGDGRGSIGRSTMRSSKLSQSFSSDSVPPFSQPAPSQLPRTSDRKKVLITRLFPVSLPIDDTGFVTPQSQFSFSEDTSGYPFPQSSEEVRAKAKKAQLKQRKTPMYAVALVISLPQAHAVSTSRSAFRGPSSYGEQESYPSSFNSARRSGWTMVGQNTTSFDTFETGFNTDVEDGIDAITQHWDVIMRTLTYLQSIVSAELLSMLKQADISSPDPLPSNKSSYASRPPSFSGRRPDDIGQKPPKTNQKYVWLFPNSLANSKQVKVEAKAAKSRIVSGLRATRVVTGQNRWGIWREEARWVGRWAGGREQGFFFFNLLTGFLSVHTDWLQALSPSKYRKQFSLQQRTKGDDDISLPARTIIVSQDKMAARRLVFLLSAFLPANQQHPTLRAQRPSTSASAFSQSPPSFGVALSKEESLRRKINRRTTPRQPSHSRTASMYTTSARSSVPAHLAHLSMENRHERRASDAASIRTTNLPLQGADVETRKTSAATTATITPENSFPHFTVQKMDPNLNGQPGSNNSTSMAADDLKRSLKRGSIGQYSNASSDSRQSSRWGSVISGLWNTRRRDSNSSTPPTRNSIDSRESFPTSPRKSISGTQRRGSLGRMLEETPSENTMPQSQTQDTSKGPDAAPHTPRLVPSDLAKAPGASRGPMKMERKPDPTGAFESPVKTTINPDDGIIDIEVPFPDFMSSFETAVSSPSSSGYLSNPGLSGLESFEQACRVAVDGDLPMNVAGWLQSYHPDFIVQTIPPQNDLIEQIKSSLRAEPTPFTHYHLDAHQERWVDVSSALIADTTTFTIKRIRYRRLVKPKVPGDRSTPMLSTSVNTMNSSLVTPLASPSEKQVQEEFVEEPIVTLDDTLIEAVERVIAQSSDVSKESSTCSSRSTSKRRTSISGSAELEDDARTTRLHIQPPTGTAQVVPRAQCKTVVLSALETIAREVVHTMEDEEHDYRHIQDPERNRHVREKESVLRQAVRSWVEAVEAGAEITS